MFQKNPDMCPSYKALKVRFSRAEIIDKNMSTEKINSRKKGHVISYLS